MKIASLSASLLFLMGLARAGQAGLLDDVYLQIGGLRSSSGLSGGLEYYNQRLWDERLRLSVEALFSHRLYQRDSVELSQPHIWYNWFFWEAQASYGNYPDVDFYGLGPDSAKDDRTTYLEEPFLVTARLGIRPRRVLRAGLLLGYARYNAGSGRDSGVPSAHEAFSDAELPGFDAQPRYRRLGAFLALDLRDERKDPSRGGLARLEWLRSSETRGLPHDYDAIVVDLQHYRPVRWNVTLALRALGRFTLGEDGQEVPFYLLPSLGATTSLAGYSSDRFRDRHALVLNAELRWRWTELVILAGFLDVGQVVPRLADVGSGGLAASAGAGIYLKMGGQVVAGVNLGVSDEGARVGVTGSYRF